MNLNLAQCANAFENLYFSSAKRVEATISAFREAVNAIRRAPAPLTETHFDREGRSGVLFDIPRDPTRLALPKTVQLRLAVRSRRFKTGNAILRDPDRVAIAKAMADEALKRGQAMDDDQPTAE